MRKLVKKEGSVGSLEWRGSGVGGLKILHLKQKKKKKKLCHGKYELKVFANQHHLTIHLPPSSCAHPLYPRPEKRSYMN